MSSTFRSRAKKTKTKRGSPLKSRRGTPRTRKGSRRSYRGMKQSIRSPRNITPVHKRNRNYRVLRQEITTYGFGKYKSDECIDDVDPISYEDFDNEKDVIYLGDGKKKQCFELQSLAKMFLKDKRDGVKSKHPMTREEFSDNARDIIIESATKDKNSSLNAYNEYVKAVENENIENVKKYKADSIELHPVLDNKIFDNIILSNNIDFIYTAIEGFTFNRNERAYVMVRMDDGSQEMILKNVIDYKIKELIKNRKNEIIKLLFDKLKLQVHEQQLIDAILYKNDDMIRYFKKFAPITGDTIYQAVAYGFIFADELFKLGLSRGTLYLKDEEYFIETGLLNTNKGYKTCLMYIINGYIPDKKVLKKFKSSDKYSYFLETIEKRTRPQPFRYSLERFEKMIRKEWFNES